MHVIPNNFLEYIAMENALSDQCFLFLDASRVCHRVMASVQRAASTPHSHLSGPLINYVPNRNVVHYRSRAGNRYKCQSTERDQ